MNWVLSHLMWVVRGHNYFFDGMSPLFTCETWWRCETFIQGVCSLSQSESGNYPLFFLLSFGIIFLFSLLISLFSKKKSVVTQSSCHVSFLSFFFLFSPRIHDKLLFLFSNDLDKNNVSHVLNSLDTKKQECKRHLDWVKSQ